jgi:nucleoside-diphosphate-sugar epimerase
LYSLGSENGHYSIHDPINLGNPEELTVNELAKAIIKLSSCSSEIHYKPLPIDDPQVRRPEISKARSLLGWEPQFSIEKGLARTIKVLFG